jgi:hypothetical protein
MVNGARNGVSLPASDPTRCAKRIEAPHPRHGRAAETLLRQICTVRGCSPLPLMIATAASHLTAE